MGKMVEAEAFYELRGYKPVRYLAFVVGIFPFEAFGSHPLIQVFDRQKGKIVYFCFINSRPWRLENFRETKFSFSPSREKNMVFFDTLKSKYVDMKGKVVRGVFSLGKSTSPVPSFGLHSWEYLTEILKNDESLNANLHQNSFQNHL